MVSDYIDVIDSLFGVTGSSIQDLCAEFGISISWVFLLFYFNIKNI